MRLWATLMAAEWVHSSVPSTVQASALRSALPLEVAMGARSDAETATTTEQALEMMLGLVSAQASAVVWAAMSVRETEDWSVVK